MKRVRPTEGNCLLQIKGGAQVWTQIFSLKHVASYHFQFYNLKIRTWWVYGGTVTWESFYFYILFENNKCLNHPELMTVLVHCLDSSPLIIHSSVICVNGKRSLLSRIIFHIKYMPFKKFNFKVYWFITISRWTVSNLGFEVHTDLHMLMLYWIYEALSKLPNLSEP